MSVDSVKRQIEIAKKKVAQAKAQIVSLERTIKEIEGGHSAQSDHQELRQQHSV
jgi:hypothetical protein